MLRFPKLTNFKILSRKFVISVIIVFKLLCGMLSFDFNKKKLWALSLNYANPILHAGSSKQRDLLGLAISTWNVTGAMN